MTYFRARADVARPRYGPTPGEAPLLWMRRVLAMPFAVRAEFFTLFHERLLALDAPASVWGLLHRHWREWQRTGWEPRATETASDWATRLASDPRNQMCFFVGAYADCAELFHQDPVSYPEWTCCIHDLEVVGTLRMQARMDVEARFAAAKCAEDAKRREDKKVERFERGG